LDTAEIRTFLIVAEVASFSRAAVRLGVPQPTLSRHIAKLEEELGSRLFYRHGRGVSLTESGQRLKVTVEPLVQKLDEVRNGIAAERGEPSGFLRFAVTPNTGRSLAASIVVAFKAQCPQVHLHLVEAFGGTLAEWLETGWVDVAILYHDVQFSEVGAVPLMNEDQFLVSLPEDASETDPVLLHDIDQSRLVLYGSGAGRRAIDKSFEAAGVALHTSLVVNSFATIKKLVEQDNLLSILPFGAVSREVLDGRLAIRKIAPPANLKMLLVARTPSCKPMTVASKVLIEVLQQQVGELFAQGWQGASDPAIGVRVVP
jgi:LysR family nitrogen assimilation transcriptional regulator